MVDRVSKISYYSCAANLKLPNGCIQINFDFPKRGFDPFLHCCKACIGSSSVTAVISSAVLLKAFGNLYRKLLQVHLLISLETELFSRAVGFTTIYTNYLLCRLLFHPIIL
jgi:hypothetical protein